MAIYTFEIPDEVTAWIFEEKGVQVKTYIQNEVVEPIIKEYEKTLGKAKRLIADEEAKTETAELKKQMKVKEQASEEITK